MTGRARVDLRSCSLERGGVAGLVEQEERRGDGGGGGVRAGDDEVEEHEPRLTDRTRKWSTSAHGDGGLNECSASPQRVLNESSTSPQRVLNECSASPQRVLNECSTSAQRVLNESSRRWRGQGAPTGCPHRRGLVLG